MGVLKNKKTVFSVITLILFLVCVCVNFYTKDAYAIRTYFSNSYDISARLYSGDVLEQEFTLVEGDQGIEFVAGTYLTVLDGGSAIAELYDANGDKVAEKEVSLAGTQDYQGVKFFFEDLDKSLYNQKCRVRFTFTDIDDQLLAVFRSGTSVKDYEYSINGEVQDHNLAMNGFKETTYIEYRDFRLFYILGIAVFLLYLALFKIDWKELKFSTCFNRIKEIVLTNWKQEHVVFFITAIFLGAVCVFSVPITAVSWDEQTHYAQTTYLSWGGTNRISEADSMIYSDYTKSNYDDIFIKENKEDWKIKINEIEEQGRMVEYFSPVQFSSITYMPASIALYIARILGFDFSTRFYIGKLTNILLYSFVVAYAIKLLKGRGKIIAATIGLIPTNIFMAASYGQDWWLIAFVILGYAMFLHELETHGRISICKYTKAVAVMCLGLVVKAVYFPIMIPMMLLKKERYEDSKKSRWIVVLGILLLVISFALPMFVNTATGATLGGGDIRGGERVNAVNQIIYILTNIPEYTATLFDFMWDYLQPDTYKKFLVQMGSRGRGDYYTLCIMLLVMATLMDNSENTLFRKKEKCAVIGAYVGALLSIILIITAMYVTYTPVGAHTVNGVQSRYITPLLFPFLFIAGENVLNVSGEIKRKIYLWCVIGMTFVSLHTFYSCFLI